MSAGISSALYNRNLNLERRSDYGNACCDRGINRKQQLLAKLLCLLDHFLAIIKLRIVYEGSTYFTVPLPSGRCKPCRRR